MKKIVVALAVVAALAAGAGSGPAAAAGGGERSAAVGEAAPSSSSDFNYRFVTLGGGATRLGWKACNISDRWAHLAVWLSGGNAQYRPVSFRVSQGGVTRTLPLRVGYLDQRINLGNVRPFSCWKLLVTNTSPNSSLVGFVQEWFFYDS